MAATWKQSITTSAGIALMNKAYGVSSIIPTKAVTITDDISGYSITQVMALTSVNYNQSRVPIVISNQANTTRIGIDIDNKDVNEQYDYYGIGVYFKQVNTGEEVLFSVIPLSGAATIIPNQNGVATSSISIDSYTSIVPGTNIDLTVSDSGSVTRADVEKIVAANQSFSFPKKPLATGIDLQSIKSIGIYQVNDDKTVVNAPDGFSGNGYLIVVGDGTTANPIVQEITDTVTGNKSINVYNSSLNKWDGWQQFSYKSYVDDSIKSANEHTDNGLATKADDSKVVHTTDMRKPASQVASIDEVNTKQDKIGYTPADDAKVVHTTDTSNWQKQAMFNPNDFKIDATTISPTVDFVTLLRTKYDKAGVFYIRDNDYPSNASPIDSVVISEGSGWWYAYGVKADGHFAYRKITSTYDSGWAISADDTKVLHNSGLATIPTDNSGLVVGNNGDIGLVKQNGYNGAIGVGSNNAFRIVQSNNSSIGIADTFHDMFKVNGNYQISLGSGAYFTPADDSKVVHTATPGIPKLAVKYNATSKAFDYTLTAPEKDGFSDILQYNLLWKDHSVDDWTAVVVKPDGLTGQLTGVDIPKTYDFKAAAQNAVGSSDYTDVITLGTAVVPGIPSLTVEYDAGKKGFDYTVIAPKSDGGSKITGYSLEYQKQGSTDWTRVALNPNIITGTVTDGIEAGSDYLFRVNAENAVGSSDYFTVSDPLPTVDGNIYGVSWDGSSSGALQRTDAAVGLKAGINGAQNDFDTRGPWGLMDKTVTDSYGNAFVRVPKFYIRKTQNKPLSTWQVSLVKQGDDWYLPNCFYDFDNNKELDYVDVSRYEGSIASGKLQSKTGATPTTNQTIVQLRSSAVANNTDGKKGYHLWDVHTLDALQVLFTIEFATLDSQSIMKGNTDNAGDSLMNNGATDNVKGSSGFVTSGSTPMTYRGIENLYGNLAMWTDGLNINNLSLYSCDDATKYASDVFASPYYKLNYSLNSGNGNITGLGFDKGHPGVTAPTSFNSDSYNTYYHDYGYVNSSGNYAVYTGGSWNWNAGYSGLWSWFGLRSSTDAYSNVGSRLLKKAL